MTTQAEKIGALTADVANLKSDLAAVKAETKEQSIMLREVRDVMVSTKGSWRTLVVLGGIMVALTSAVTSLVIKFWPGN